MKKGWYRYLLAELVAILLVVSFFWVSHVIQARKVYHLSVATLLSSYKEDSLAFQRKYDKHVVFLTGKVNYVAYQDVAYIQMIDPNSNMIYDTSEYEDNSIRCTVNNQFLKLFETSILSEDIVTIKGILHVNTTEVVLKDCIKVEDKGVINE